MAPLAKALASNSASERAVIMMTGVVEPWAVSSSLRSIPLMPGMCTSVITQSDEAFPAAAINSSAEAYPSAEYPERLQRLDQRCTEGIVVVDDRKPRLY